LRDRGGEARIRRKGYTTEQKKGASRGRRTRPAHRRREKQKKSRKPSRTIRGTKKEGNGADGKRSAEQRKGRWGETIVRCRRRNAWGGVGRSDHPALGKGKKEKVKGLPMHLKT